MTISNCASNILGKCVKWRQTGECSPDGPREPIKDQRCYRVIDDGWSGYCECDNGRKMMEKGCEIGDFSTCDEACTVGKDD